MDAQLRKIVATPAKFDENGDIKSQEFATLTLDVPLDSSAQREAILELMSLLDNEWIKVDISASQLRINVGQSANKGAA